MEAGTSILDPALRNITLKVGKIHSTGYWNTVCTWSRIGNLERQFSHPIYVRGTPPHIQEPASQPRIGRRRLRLTHRHGVYPVLLYHIVSLALLLGLELLSNIDCEACNGTGIILRRSGSPRALQAYGRRLKKMFILGFFFIMGNGVVRYTRFV